MDWLRDSLRKEKTELKVAGFERSKSWSRKMLGMFNFGGCEEGGVLFNNDDVEDLFDSGDGVVSREEPPEAVDIDEDNEGNLSLTLCLT